MSDEDILEFGVKKKIKPNKNIKSNDSESRQSKNTKLEKTKNNKPIQDKNIKSGKLKNDTKTNDTKPIQDKNLKSDKLKNDTKKKEIEIFDDEEITFKPRRQIIDTSNLTITTSKPTPPKNNYFEEELNKLNNTNKTKEFKRPKTSFEIVSYYLKNKLKIYVPKEIINILIKYSASHKILNDKLFKKYFKETKKEYSENFKEYSSKYTGNLSHNLTNYDIPKNECNILKYITDVYFLKITEENQLKVYNLIGKLDKKFIKKLSEKNIKSTNFKKVNEKDIYFHLCFKTGVKTKPIKKNIIVLNFSNIVDDFFTDEVISDEEYYKLQTKSIIRKITKDDYCKSANTKEDIE